MKNKNVAVGALVGLLVLALGWNFVVKPSRSEASKVKAETAVEQAKLPPLEAQLSRARLEESHAKVFKAQLASLQQAIPDSPALAEFIRAANAIAAASNISWQSVTHAPPTPGATGMAVITVGIQVKGTYAQVMDYLARLSALKRLLVVDGLQFAAVGQTGASGGAGESTGPFSGGSELSVTISARMFVTAAAGVGSPSAVPVSTASVVTSG
jgi:Tfp pilus assembly protein PilO